MSTSHLSPEAIEDIYTDFVKCEILATRLASHFPEEPGVWVGTVSERLNRLVELLQKQTAQLQRQVQTHIKGLQAIIDLQE